MTPITLSDGRTLVLEHVTYIGPPSDDIIWLRISGQEHDFRCATPDDLEAIRSALFEAQRREIAVKMCAGYDVADSSPSEIALLVASAFDLADAILASEKKGAEQ